jgi:pyruvate/2-oxoglutarate dehydrogenase complex dihydrolipoamide acyltransferase (E2) component
MSSVDILVPDLPESVADATVATWHKKPGDAVQRDEVLVEIETDKVVLEVPASADGILDAVLEDEGATVLLARSSVACVKATARVKSPARKPMPKSPPRLSASRRLWKSRTTMR